jgi:hypothetical protein
MRSTDVSGTARCSWAVGEKHMPGKLVSSEVYFGPLFAYTVIVVSFLGGMAFGGLLCFRHRRTGILTLAATCAGVALIVGVSEIAEGGRTIGHVLKVAAGLASLPIVGAAFACVIIGIARLLWGVARRKLKAIWAFTGDVLTDVLRIVKRPTSGQECGPRTLSKAFLLSLVFLALTGIILFQLNIGAIWNVATRFTPRLSIVTNVLDLLSLILVTPKFFTIEARDNVRNVSVQTLRSFAMNKIIIPRTTITSILFGAVLVSLFFLSLLMLAYSVFYQASQLVVLDETVNKIFPSPLFDYIRKHVIEIQMVYTRMWPFAVSVTIVSVVLAIAVILLSALAKESTEDQEKLKDKLLFWGLVLFAYSRALSMIG